MDAADRPDRAKAFLKKYGWKWPQLPDTNRALSKRFGVLWQPAVILVDARGRVVGVDQSYEREQGWNRLAAKLP